MRHSRGFTLIELLVVIVLVSIGALGLGRMFANNFSTLSTSTKVQVMSQFAQECAETVLATRRGFGVDSAKLVSTMCGTDPAGFSRQLSLSAKYAGTSTSACPQAVQCIDAVVTVCAGTAVNCAAAQVKSTVRLLLVQY